jgi:hypothetical protein
MKMSMSMLSRLFIWIGVLLMISFISFICAFLPIVGQIMSGIAVMKITETKFILMHKRKLLINIKITAFLLGYLLTLYAQLDVLMFSWLVVILSLIIFSVSYIAALYQAEGNKGK